MATIKVSLEDLKSAVSETVGVDASKVETVQAIVYEKKVDEQWS